MGERIDKQKARLVYYNKMTLLSFRYILILVILAIGKSTISGTVLVESTVDKASCRQIKMVSHEAYHPKPGFPGLIEFGKNVSGTLIIGKS